LAYAFLWEHSYKRLKLAQLLGQLGVFLTCWWMNSVAASQLPQTRSLTYRPAASARGGTARAGNRRFWLLSALRVH
jgi:hypothetical protein